MKRNYFFTLIALITSSFIHAQTESYLPFENRELTIEKVMAGIVLLFVYFIPTIISWNKRNSKLLMVCNLFIGWTGIGWFLSLLWALNINRQHTIIIVQEKKKRKQDKKEAKLKALLDIDSTDF